MESAREGRVILAIMNIIVIGPEKNGYGSLLERETQSEETKIYPRI